MKNVENTYFGFTNNLKPLQRGKAEKSLDMLVRYKDKVMTEKEFVLLKLKENYTPSYEENFQYYKRNGELSKPKTLYKLEKDNGYQEINKTLYNYAKYLLENKFTNEQIAAEYIQKELDQQAEQLRLEQEEKERQRMERQKAEEERKQKHAEKRKQWHDEGLKLMNDSIKEAISNAVNEHWEQIKQVYPNTEKEILSNDIVNRFTEQLGNQEYIKGNVSYLFHDDINKNNLSNKIYKSIYKDIFNATDSDSKQTLTAKVKAFYNGKEYKGGNYNPKEQEDFYILNRNKQFELKQGEKIKINGLTCFIYKNEKELYVITESRTGLSLGSPRTTKKDALEYAKQGVEKAGERLEGLIQNSINRYGLSPLYKESQAV